MIAIHSIAHVMHVACAGAHIQGADHAAAGPQQPEPAKDYPFCRSASDGHCIAPSCPITPAACSAVATEQAFKFFEDLKVSSNTQNGLAV